MTARAQGAPVADPPCLAAALDYASRGWSVIPLRPKDKRPLLREWKEYQSRRATEIEIREWWARNPAANVGVIAGAVSGLVVLDVDGKNGHESLKSLPGVEHDKAPVVVTGKGFHAYYRHPGGTVSNRAGMLPGLDLRGDGGYVVAPPSVHPSGRVYAFAPGCGLDTPVSEPAPSLQALIRGDVPATTAPASAAVLNFADARPQSTAASPAIDRHAASALEREIGRVVSADEGTRNNVLNEAAFNIGQLVGAGSLSRSEVERRLLAAALRSGLSDAEATATIQSGLAAGMASPRDLSAVGAAQAARPATRFTAGAADPASQRQSAPQASERAREPAAPTVFNISDFRLDRMTTGTPPERQWLTRGGLPLAVPAIVFGPGGVGKSLAVLDLCVKVSTRHLNGPISDPQTFLGPVPAGAAGAAVFITLEDDRGELHRRTAALDKECRREGAPLYVLPGLDMPGFDPTLIRPEGRAAVLTRFAVEGLDELLQAVADSAGVPVRLLALDPAGDLLDGSEDDASVVKPLMRRMREVAARHGCTIVLVGHAAKGQLDSDSVAARGMRGSGAWIANSRAAFGLWRPERGEAEQVLRQLELEPTDSSIGRVVFGMIVKSNAPISLGGLRRYLQHPGSGLLIDVTDGLRAKRIGDQDTAALLLLDAIREAAEAEVPYQIEGGSGLYKGRADLPSPLNTWGENRLRQLGNSLLEARSVEKCKLGGRGAMCWLDVPGGGYSTGQTMQIAAGSRAEALRLHRERAARITEAHGA